MYVDTFSLDAINWDLEEDSREIKDDFRGCPVCVLNQTDAIQNIAFGMTHQPGKSLQNRKIEMKAYMQKISEVEIGYKRTNSDGKADEITVRVELKGDRENDKETSNADQDTKTKDIDSRDRDQG